MLGRGPACYSLLLSSMLLLLGGVSSGFAQSESGEPPTASERAMLAERFAAEKLWAWQRRLNLKDWDISVAVVHAGDLKKNTVGNIRWDRDKKTALIRVLDPADYHIPFDAILKDIEFTVVHELIHLEMSPVLADLNRTDANRMEEEYAVNHMTDALLKLDRGTK